MVFIFSNSFIDGQQRTCCNYLHASAELIPLVVDSDVDKVGTYVPGTGQIIQSRDILKTLCTDIVIIPTQWRAKDIVSEIQRESLKVNKIIIEHNEKLIDFIEDAHPYK